MATPLVHVSGPMRVRAGLLDDGVANVPVNVLGHSRDGVFMELQENYDDVFTDDFGPDGWRDRVMIGTKCFLDFELHAFDRAHLEDFLWFYDTVGTRSRIGRKLSDLDGLQKTIHVAFESETDQIDLHFLRVGMIRASQRVGTRHTVVNCRAEAIIAEADKFFDTTDIVDAAVGTDVPEVAGGAEVLLNSTELGFTQDGLEILLEYFYDDVQVDPKGPETNFEKVVTGQSVSVNMDLHAYDKANLENALGLYGTNGYGALNSIGSLGSVEAIPLVLDSSLNANGRDWTFDKVVLGGAPRQLFSARHSTVTNLQFASIPTAAGQYYSSAAGAP